MKLRNILTIVATVPAFVIGTANVAWAHRIIHVEGTLYVIICDNNGGNFTFSGSATGAGDVAGLLCPTAMVGGGTGGATASPIVIEQSKPAVTVLNTRPKGATVKECPSGTHWYEPAKACVANGGHPN